MTLPLTDRQRQALKFIRSHKRKTGSSPTFREIGAALGLRETNGVSEHLGALERKGYIKRERGKRRAITVLRGTSE